MRIWQAVKQIFISRGTTFTIKRGVPLIKYNTLLDGFVSICKEDVKVAQVLAECLTINPSSSISDDVQVTIVSSKTAREFSNYLVLNDIKFTKEL